MPQKIVLKNKPPALVKEYSSKSTKRVSENNLDPVKRPKIRDSDNLSRTIQGPARTVSTQESVEPVENEYNGELQVAESDEEEEGETAEDNGCPASSSTMADCQKLYAELEAFNRKCLNKNHKFKKALRLFCKETQSKLQLTFEKDLQRLAEIENILERSF